MTYSVSPTYLHPHESSVFHLLYPNRSLKPFISSPLLNYRIFEVRVCAWFIAVRISTPYRDSKCPGYLLAEWMDMKYSSLATICCLRLLMSLFPTSIIDNQKFTNFSIQFLQHAYKIKKTVNRCKYSLCISSSI